VRTSAPFSYVSNHPVAGCGDLRKLISGTGLTMVSLPVTMPRSANPAFFQGQLSER
jgi:hypothetical protein